MDRIIIEGLLEIAKDKYENRESKYCKGEIHAYNVMLGIIDKEDRELDEESKRVWLDY